MAAQRALAQPGLAGGSRLGAGQRDRLGLDRRRGSHELVAAICADAEIEALPLPVDAVLTDDGDTVNG